MFKSTFFTVSILLASLVSAAPSFSNLSTRELVCDNAFNAKYATPPTSCVCLYSNFAPVPNVSPYRCVCKLDTIPNGPPPNCAPCDSSTTKLMVPQDIGSPTCICKPGLMWLGINAEGKGYCGCPGEYFNSNSSCVPCDGSTTFNTPPGSTQCRCKNPTMQFLGIINGRGTCGCPAGTTPSGPNGECQGGSIFG